MLVFSSDNYYIEISRYLSEQMAAEIGAAEIDRYGNGEIHASIQNDVKSKDCVIVGSIAPPDSHMMAFLTLANAVKRGGARKLYAFMPYLAYARQDKPKPGESGGAALAGALLRAAGVDAIVTFDVHSDLDRQQFGLPLLSLSPSALFASELQKLGWSDAYFVAPDSGAIHRAEACAQALGSTKPVAHFLKKRSNNIHHFELVGNIPARSRVVVVDDIIDSGSTLISACKILREQRHVQEIAIAVTHGLFTSEHWADVFNFKVTNFLVTQSCPQTAQQTNTSLTVLPLTPLLQNVATELQRGIL